MRLSKKIVHKRHHLKGGLKEDYYINSSCNKKPRGGSEGINTIFETTSFMDCPLCIARWRRGGTNGGSFEISVSWAVAWEDSSVSMV